MKSQSGITLTALVIYVIVATIIIATMAVISSFFFSNMSLIKSQDQYAVEFNKFNMFFINDVKENHTAQVESSKIVFEDGTTYQYIAQEQAVYRNDVKIARKLQELTFTANTYLVPNTTTTKNLINVSMKIKKNNKAESSEAFQKTIEYVLKYW